MASFDDLTVGSLTILGTKSGDNVTLSGLADLAAAVDGASADAVTLQAAVVAAPSAITAAAAAGSTPTKAEHDALVVDVTALRLTVAGLLTALKGAGKPMAAS